MHCEVLTEIISIQWKIFHRICAKGDRNMAEKMLSNAILFENLQLLLAVTHSLLLRCVLECMLSFLEK